MVTVGNQSSKVNGDAARVRWISLKNNSRQKEQNGSKCLDQGGQHVPKQEKVPRRSDLFW